MPLVGGRKTVGIVWVPLLRTMSVLLSTGAPAPSCDVVDVVRPVEGSPFCRVVVSVSVTAVAPDPGSTSRAPPGAAEGLTTVTPLPGGGREAAGLVEESSQCLLELPGFSPRRSEDHTSELQSLRHLVCRLLHEKKNKIMERTS